MTRAFDKIAAGLEDAIAFAEGDVSRGRKAKPAGRKPPTGKADAKSDSFSQAAARHVFKRTDW